jgi:hypothetical protein
MPCGGSKQQRIINNPEIEVKEVANNPVADITDASESFEY